MARRRFDLEDKPPPFSLVLAQDLPPNIREVHCQQIYRHLPGKRLVCAATWAGKQVFVKIYFHRWRAKTHWRREERGLRLLSRCGIATPPLLRSQYIEHLDCYILILGAIAPAQTFGETWAQRSNIDERRSLLHSMARVFSELHEAGSIQSDPHFNNFLVSGGRVYTLDGSDIRKLPVLFAKRRAMRNLAAFFAILRSEHDELIASAADEYFKLRGWTHNPRSTEALVQLTMSIRERNDDDYLRSKIFRDCTPFAAHRSWGLVWSCDRRFYTPSMQELLHAPDLFLSQRVESHLKRGGSATVASVGLDNISIVIKAYHAKHFIHAIRRAFGKTRAARSWTNAQRLRIYGIATAEPVAWAEKRFGPFRRSAFFLSRYVSGPNLSQFMESDTASEAEKLEMAQRVVELLESLKRGWIVHGDLKATNIIAHEGKAVLMDLDAMRYLPKKRAFTARFAEDIERFLRNWEGNELMDRYFRDRLAYLLEPGPRNG